MTVSQVYALARVAPVQFCGQEQHGLEIKKQTRCEKYPDRFFRRTKHAGEPLFWAIENNNLKQGRCYLPFGTMLDESC